MHAVKVMLGLMLGTGLSMSAAHAGLCEEEYAQETVVELEAFAKKPKKERPSLDQICMETIVGVPKLGKRVIAACTKVIEREPDFIGCLEWSAKLGAKQLGTVELFGAVQAAFKLDPFLAYSQTLPIYEALGDARAVPLVRQAWEAALADKRSKQTRHEHTFKVWRHAALRLFGVLGGAEEKAFLEGQQAAIKDRGLQKAFKKAIAAIDQRSAGGASATPTKALTK